MRLYRCGAQWFTNEFEARKHGKRIVRAVFIIETDGSKDDIVRLLNGVYSARVLK